METTQITEELKLLNRWKQLFNEPNHKRLTSKRLEVAQVGLLPQVNNSLELNRRIVADNLKDIGYLGQFPLIIIEIDDVDSYELSKTIKPTQIITVNPTYKERGIFTDFIALKYGVITQEYFDAYYNQGD